MNGAFLEASFVTALLLFIVWTLETSVYLVRVPSRAPGRVAHAAPMVGG